MECLKQEQPPLNNITFLLKGRTYNISTDPTRNRFMRTMNHEWLKCPRFSEHIMLKLKTLRHRSTKNRTAMRLIRQQSPTEIIIAMKVVHRK